MRNKTRRKSRPKNTDSPAKPSQDPCALPQRDRDEIAAKYPVAQHPIKHPLAVAAFERAIRLRKLAPSSSPYLKAVINVLPETLQLGAELEELTKWVAVPIRSDVERLRRTSSAISTLVDAGLSTHEIVDASQTWQATPRGRPATTRFVAVDALELWLLNPGKSWTQVTREVCNCGQVEHGPVCHERLRQQINDLRACLKKYGIKEPPRKSGKG